MDPGYQALTALCVGVGGTCVYNCIKSLKTIDFYEKFHEIGEAFGMTNRPMDGLTEIVEDEDKNIDIK